MAIKFKCYICQKKKTVTDWHQFFQFDGNKFCSKACADKYQRARTKRDIQYYKGSMDQAGKFNHEALKQRKIRKFAIDDLPF
ncbi:hypothetical protein [Limosilactobacillus coleohominis]|uniref:hypothetical protein n=1 Tax=Limosilactobacillus coleohominis TaxID=181675 RepID=UPI00031DA325|nr:hypothetical protein [Limosilactobacillus coleohominis]